MLSSNNLDSFLDRVMRINVLRMGGASAGVIGSSGADNDIVNNLKKSTAAFAHEYRKPTSDQDELIRLSQEIAGYLQTLQLTYTVSKEEVDKLTNDLQTLVDPTSV